MVVEVGCLCHQLVAGWGAELRGKNLTALRTVSTVSPAIARKDIQEPTVLILTSFCGCVLSLRAHGTCRKLSNSVAAT